MQELDHLISTLAGYLPDADLSLVRRAYQFAAEAHDGQTHRSGEPYVTHPLAVARLIAELKLDVASVCAGLLHHCVEIRAATVEQLVEIFGKEIAFLVDGVTKLGNLPYSTRDAEQAENFRKMLLAIARDIRVILVKLCDRLDHMRSPNPASPEKQERIAAETMQIYAPIANRLGIRWVQIELEDLAFKCLRPGEYEQLTADIAKTRAGRLDYIHHVEKLIHKEMTDNGVPCEVTGRVKHLWSIYQKMARIHRPFEEIHDAIGFRIITDTVMHCYQALGLAHQTWSPFPGRFKDYVALPKPNAYQSLHTTVTGPRGERIEIQIRTADMHRLADGMHWQYKEGKPLAPGDEKKFAWLRQLMRGWKDLRDPLESTSSVMFGNELDALIDVFGNEVYVFTPGGDVKELPKGSCPIDFAYAVHSSVGDRCASARANGVVVPLRYQLRTGDTVEIITSPTPRPNRSWLGLVKTARARARIRKLLRREERERAVALGTALIDKALCEHRTTRERADAQLQIAARELGCATIDELIVAVAYGKLSTQEVLEKVLPELDGPKRHPEQEADGMPKTLLRKTAWRELSSSRVKVASEDVVVVRFATCCSPRPDDPIVGFLARGRGVTVHRRDCDKSLGHDAERRIDVEWDKS